MSIASRDAFGKIVSTRDWRDRFWSLVDPVDDANGCWNWTAALNHGYGFFTIRPGSQVKAHRASWAMENGPIPDGMVVMHSCDNPRCVNPGHLSVGTPLENNTDKLRKGRQTARHPPEAIAEVLRREVPQKALAKKLGMAPSYVSYLQSGRGRGAQ